MEVRVGHEKPVNSESDFVIECLTAIEGRYITVQSIITSTEPAFNIVEVILETEPLAEKIVETIKDLERSSHMRKRISFCL